MYFTKPANLKYVDCAIYIDTHVRDKDRDEQKLFEYMYHLFYILAVKGRFFTRAKDYNDYALYGATHLFLRYQKELDGNTSLKPIKSSLNYIKSILYPMKVDYQKENFNEVFQEESLGGTPDKIKEDLYCNIKRNNEGLLDVEYKEYLGNIDGVIKIFLNSLPYKNDKAITHNIYLSCVLTILKTITMSNENKAKIKNRLDKDLPTIKVIDQIYKEEFYDDIILWHLDNSMRNYIMVLVAKIKKLIAKDLRCIIGSFEPTEEVIKAILTSPLKEMQVLENGEKRKYGF